MNSSIRYNKKTLLHKALSGVLMFVVVIQSVGIVPLEVFADEILSSEPAPIVENVVTEEAVPSETVSPEEAIAAEVTEEGSVVSTEPIASEEAPVTEEEAVVTEQVETQVVQEESNVSAVTEAPSVSYSTFAGSCPFGKDCEMFVKSPGSILDPGEGIGYRAVCSSSAQICLEQGYEDVICDPGYWTKSSWSSPVDNFQMDYSAGQWVTYGASSGDKEYWSSITCQRNSTVVDVCANLPDVQTTIPSGYEFDVNGACVLSSSGSPTPSYRGTAPEGLVFIETFENVYAGQSIRLLGSYSDVDGNLYKATIRDLGISDDKEGDLGAYPAIGESGEIIAGEVSAIERIFTIPVGVSGRYWFRTEVVDTEGNSDVMWNSLQVYPAQNGSGPICPTSYPDETVTARLNGGPVWGTYQYTSDSDVSVAVVHQGILTPGQSATIRKTPIGFFSGYMGTTQYGVTSLSYTAWCGVSFSIVPGTLVDAPTTPTTPTTNELPQATLTVTPSNPRAGDVVTITGTYSDADGNLHKATIRNLGTGNKGADLGEYPAIGQLAEIINGSTATLVRTFTIPTDASGTYWFRTEVVDTNNSSTNNSSDIEWASVNIRPAVPAPQITISATPSTFVRGSQTTIVWAVSDATSCTASGLWSGSKALSGTESFTPDASGSFTLVCVGPEGLSSTASAGVTVTTGGGGGNSNPTPSVTLTASPSTIVSGATAVLSWSSQDAITCEASQGWSGVRTVSGTQTVGPLTANTTYTINCTSAQGKVGTATITVNVTPNGGGNGGSNPLPLFNLFGANPSTVLTGATSVLTWDVSNALSCTASDGWTGSKSVSGSETVGPLSATTIFTLACTGAGGTATSSISISVNQNNGGGGTGPLSPVVAISANPTHIQVGNSSIVTWSTTNATSCTASDAWTGNQSLSGTLTVNPTTAGTLVYTLACTGTGGTATSSVSILVDPAPTTTGGGGGTSGGGGGGGGRSGGPCIGYNCPKSTTTPDIMISIGEVLGTSTSGVCMTGDYITTYMRKGMNNNPVEVRKLQYFLKTFESLDVEITGRFDDKTEQAVMVFQARYPLDILAPWDISLPTGYVYITTKNKINSILCGSYPAYQGIVKDNSIGNVLYEDLGVNVVGLISATNTANTIDTSNLALVMGSFNDMLVSFLKDMWWYPLLILLLIILGTTLIIRAIIIKDRNIHSAKEYLISGVTALSVASVLNVLNTLSFIINPLWFASRSHFTFEWIMFLDAVNIFAFIVIGFFVLFSLYFRNHSED